MYICSKTRYILVIAVEALNMRICVLLLVIFFMRMYIYICKVVTKTLDWWY